VSRLGVISEPRCVTATIWLAARGAPQKLGDCSLEKPIPQGDGIVDAATMLVLSAALKDAWRHALTNQIVFDDHSGAVRARLMHHIVNLASWANSIMSASSKARWIGLSGDRVGREGRCKSRRRSVTECKKARSRRYGPFALRYGHAFIVTLAPWCRPFQSCRFPCYRWNRFPCYRCYPIGLSWRLAQQTVRFLTLLRNLAHPGNV